MEKRQQNIDSTNSGKAVWLANQIFKAFPREVSGLKFYILDCGCIYYQRIYGNGDLDAKIGIYRDAEHGACEICVAQTKTWENRVIDGNVNFR